MPTPSSTQVSYKIDKGISIPVRVRHGKVGRMAVYPWKQLEVGDSFFVPNKTPRMLGAAGMAIRFEIKVKTRAVDGGCRVWRVA